MSGYRSSFILSSFIILLAACSSLPSWMGGEKKEEPKLAGERTTVLPAEGDLAPDAALAGLPVELLPPVTNIEWPQHTGTFSPANAHLAARGDFSDSLSARAGEGAEFDHTLVPRPVTGGDLVFAMDAEGHVSAHEAADISNVRWQSPGLAEEDEPDTLGGGLAYDQGRLFGVSGRGRVAAWDAATGRELWRASIRIPLRSPPIVAGGRLFAITIDSQTYAFNALNGQVLWTHRGIAEVAGLMNSVSPVVAGNLVIAPYASGEIYALSAESGRELWNDSLASGRRGLAGSAFSGIGGDPVVDGEVVFAVSQSGLLTALRLLEGQPVWERRVAAINTPWVAGNFLFLLTSDNTLACFLKYDGRVRWAVRLPSYEDEEEKRDPIVWRGPVLVNGKLAVTGSHGKMLLISAADGSTVATVDIPDGIFAPPIIANGRMYLVSQDATLYSLQ